ncbi:MAG: MBL fold metallo-hydrolase [Bacteroidia bacterium]|nr:MBL fold metallo-hydrolase [Bacteroidia bacterium]
MKKLSLLFILCCCFIPFQTIAQEDFEKGAPTDPLQMFRQGQDKEAAEQIIGPIYWAEGFGNTFMIRGKEANLIIDTSMPFNAERHKELLRKINDKPTRYIILTHGHKDHRGGVSVWKEEETEVIAHENFEEFRHYQERLAPFFNRRGNAQFNTRNPDREAQGNYAAEIEADLFVEDSLILKWEELTIKIYHAPGETYDHLNVWIPELKAAFVGDNFYRSFPNIYTLRGTKPRWALDYVQSLDRVLGWEPDVLIPSHGPALKGKEKIEKLVKKYRDVILYVHDETVRGMNEGKAVEQLMREIKLPPSLSFGGTYGKIAWSIRGIYEGYSGWFDANPSSMYSSGPESVYPDLVEMMGGLNKLNEKIEYYIGEKKYEKALHLADIGLTYDPVHRKTLLLKKEVLSLLLQGSQNVNEKGWLSFGIREIDSIISGNNK